MALCGDVMPLNYVLYCKSLKKCDEKIKILGRETYKSDIKIKNKSHTVQPENVFCETIKSTQINL